MDTGIFLHKMRYKFVIIRPICLRILGSVKRGDRTLMGRSRSNFSPKLEPIYRTNACRPVRFLCTFHVSLLLF